MVRPPAHWSRTLRNGDSASRGVVSGVVHVVGRQRRGNLAGHLHNPRPVQRWVGTGGRVKDLALADELRRESIRSARELEVAGRPERRLIALKNRGRNCPDGRGPWAWIGARAIILLGVAIREGSVIAAGTVVGTDCDPYTRYAESQPGGQGSQRLVDVNPNRSDWSLRMLLRLMCGSS